MSLLSDCPICQEANVENMHNCKYCGAVLTDRRHCAPSQAPPALVSRPQSHYDLLSVQSSQLLTSEDSLSEALTIDSESSEGGLLTIDTDFDDLESVDSLKKSSKALYKTIDEVSDGLSPIDLNTPLPELVFPDEPRIQLERPQAKLSDLSGARSLESMMSSEPGFNRDSSIISHQGGLSALAELGASPQTGSHGSGPSLSTRVLGFSVQILVFAIVCIGVLWILDPAGLSISELSISELISSPSSPETVPLDIESEKSESEKSESEKSESEKSESEKSESEISVAHFAAQKTDSGVILSADKKTRSERGERTEDRSLDRAKGGSAVKDESLSKPIESTKLERQNDDPSEAQKPSSIAQREGLAKSNAKSKTKSKTKSNQSPSKNSYRLLMKRGERSLMRGRVSESKKVFQRAHKLKPNRPEPLAQLGWCEIDLKRMSNGIAYFKRALSLKSTHGDSLYGLGYAYEKIGNKSNALKYFKKYLKRYPQGSKVRVIQNKMKRL